ncbi:MAG TPA: pyridoxamine 5'-phosphate oxidase family protein [Phenylobacterium sp.]
MDANLSGDPFAVTTLDQLLALYDTPRELVLKKVTHRLEPRTLAFSAAAPFAILATSGPQGVHATPRGDDPGFIVPLDDRTLALPDRRGNNRLDGLRDIVANPAVALLFLVPGAGEALRVNGTARITTDPALRARFEFQESSPRPSFWSRSARSTCNAPRRSCARSSGAGGRGRRRCRAWAR